MCPAGRDGRLRTLDCQKHKVGPLTAGSFQVIVGTLVRAGGKDSLLVALERVVGAHESGRKCMYIQLRSGDNGVTLASERCCVDWVDRGGWCGDYDGVR